LPSGPAPSDWKRPGDNVDVVIAVSRITERPEKIVETWRELSRHTSHRA
jgi:hypothetical protein